MTGVNVEQRVKNSSTICLRERSGIPEYVFTFKTILLRFEVSVGFTKYTTETVIITLEQSIRLKIKEIILLRLSLSIEGLGSNKTRNVLFLCNSPREFSTLLYFTLLYFLTINNCCVSWDGPWLLCYTGFTGQRLEYFGPVIDTSSENFNDVLPDVFILKLFMVFLLPL